MTDPIAGINYAGIVSRAMAGQVTVLRTEDGHAIALLAPVKVAEAVRDVVADAAADRPITVEGPPVPLAEVIRELDLDLEELLYRRSIVDIWQPVPDEQMHRSDHRAHAVHSPGPGSVALVSMDDRGTTCGIYFDPAAARAVSRLLETAADRAEGR